MNKKQQLKLVSPIPPSVNHYLSYRAIMRNGKPLAMSYKTREAVRYQQDFIKYVRKQVVEQKWRPLRDKYQHYYVDAVFYFPRIDMDASNYFKCMLDAITETGLIWFDDNVVCERVQRIYYDTDNPRIELEITPVDYCGIFDNAEELEQFEQRCSTCMRHRRNCSILNGIKIGRTLPEVAGKECTKYKTLKGSSELKDD